MVSIRLASPPEQLTWWRSTRRKSTLTRAISKRFIGGEWCGGHWWPLGKIVGGGMLLQWGGMERENLTSCFYMYIFLLLLVCESFCWMNFYLFFSVTTHMWNVRNSIVAVVGAAAPYNITNCPTDAPDWSAVDPVVDLIGPTCGKNNFWNMCSVKLSAHFTVNTF